MKIFMTGVSGFLGSASAEELCRRGHSLIALVRKTSKTRHLKHLDIQYVEGSLSDLPDLKTVLSSVDVVIHIAGVIKALTRQDFFKVNAEGVKNLVDQILSCNNKPKLFLHVSTIAVHNPEEGPDFCLAPDQCHPLSYYGQSKLSGEKVLKNLEEKIATVTLRPPVLYGPRDQECLPFFQAVKKGLVPLYQKGGNELSMCYVSDVAKAIADLSESKPASGSIYCIDDGKIHSWKSIAETITKIMDKNVRYLHLPKFMFYVAALGSDLFAIITRKAQMLTLNKLKEVKKDRWVCGFEKIQKDIGWKPEVSLEEGLKRTLEYYQREELL